MKRNPPWTRDELILALDLYFRVNPVHTSEKHPEIQALSRLLNQLPIHDHRPIRDVFRNPNGVYMKLCNFLRFDPDYKGTGLVRGGKAERIVWDEFSTNRARLRSTARAIQIGAPTISRDEVAAIAPSSDDEFSEGRLLSAIHLRRERSSTLVQRKKSDTIRGLGKLACEACDFDFEKRYGSLGAGFAECHHTLPLSESAARRATKLTDLVIVCANCHRMLHRSRPMLSIEALRRALR